MMAQVRRPVHDGRHVLQTIFKPLVWTLKVSDGPVNVKRLVLHLLAFSGFGI
jgi:hypothetical protein